MKLLGLLAKPVTFAALLCFLSVSIAAKLDLSPKAAYLEACALSRYTCKGIPAPHIRETIFVDRGGAYGWYWGGRTIYLTPGMSPEMRYVVMVHEMVHYLQCYEDAKCFPRTAPFETCVVEEEAFEVSDQVIRRLGADKVAPLGLRLDMIRASCGIGQG